MAPAPSILEAMASFVQGLVAVATSAMYNPDLIVVIGDPGVGKTTLLNGMAGYEGAAGDDLFEGVTGWEDVEVKMGPRLASGKTLKVIDTPGLGGPKGKLTEWLTNLLDILSKQAKHVAGIVLILDGVNPRIQMASHLMTQIVPALLNRDGNPWDRICLVVSKCNMERSIYQRVGPEEVKEKLISGLEKSNCPRLDTLNDSRDIVFCGNEGEAPAYDALLRRLSEMTRDKTVPDVARPEEAVPIVTRAMAEAVGDLIDGQPVAAVAKNMVNDAMNGAMQKGCCDCCTIA